MGMNRYAGRKAPLKLLTLTLKILAINRSLTHGAAERSNTGITVALAFIMECIDWRRLPTVCVCMREKEKGPSALIIHPGK